jgi:cytochrome b subunit of formate dehydrogenase
MKFRRLLAAAILLTVFGVLLWRLSLDKNWRIELMQGGCILAFTFLVLGIVIALWHSPENSGGK